MENTLAGQKPFAVHWLNNKELVYGIGAEKLLAEALIADQPMANPSSDSTTTRSKYIIVLVRSCYLREM